jgi:hypothetical protein
MAVSGGRSTYAGVLIKNSFSWLIGLGRLGAAGKRFRDNGLGFFLDLS